MTRILLMMLFISNCNNYDKIDNVPFHQTIISIRQDIKDLTWVEEPLSRSQANPIINNPEMYMDSLISMIKDTSVLVIEKEIGLVLMRNLNKINTIRMTDSIFQYVDNKILYNWVHGIYGNKHLTVPGIEFEKRYNISKQ